MELQLAIDLLNKEDAAELANKVKDWQVENPYNLSFITIRSTQVE